jgi:5'-nucleotidase
MGAKRMHILATNDDGVTAPGLLALVQAIQFLGEISILAPDRNWSGGGHVKTLDRPLRIKELSLSDGIEAMTSDGAPSDCVALALLGYLPHKVDLVVAGINPMANVGHDVTYSGTVTAAMEAIIWGVPAIAFSLDTGENHLGELDYGPASQIAQRIVSTVFDRRLPAGILLNVNIPYLPGDEIKGIRITRQGMRLYRDRLEQRVDPRGRPYFWIGGDAPTGIPEDGTDIGALSDGNVSVTPLQLDLTAYPALHLLRSWDWKEKHPQEYKMMDVSEYSNTSESYLK